MGHILCNIPFLCFESRGGLSESSQICMALAMCARIASPIADRADCVGYFRLWVEIGAGHSQLAVDNRDGEGTSGRGCVRLTRAPLTIYGLPINGPTRGQRHLSITNGTFALPFNAREAIWLNNYFLFRNKRLD